MVHFIIDIDNAKKHYWNFDLSGFKVNEEETQLTNSNKG